MVHDITTPKIDEIFGVCRTPIYSINRFYSEWQFGHTFYIRKKDVTELQLMSMWHHGDRCLQTCHRHHAVSLINRIFYLLTKTVSESFLNIFDKKNVEQFYWCTCDDKMLFAFPWCIHFLINIVRLYEKPKVKKCSKPYWEKKPILPWMSCPR